MPHNNLRRVLELKKDNKLEINKRYFQKDLNGISKVLFDEKRQLKIKGLVFNGLEIFKYVTDKG